MSIVIPTRKKDKLPKGFAYPVWPSCVTEAMQQVPQAEDLELVFQWRDEFWASRWLERVKNSGTVTLLQAEYREDGSPYFPKWKITVFSVPDAAIESTRMYLMTKGLIQLAAQMGRHEAVPHSRVMERISFDLESGLPVEPAAHQQEVFAGVSLTA